MKGPGKTDVGIRRRPVPAVPCSAGIALMDVSRLRPLHHGTGRYGHRHQRNAGGLHRVPCHAGWLVEPNGPAHGQSHLSRRPGWTQRRHDDVLLGVVDV